MMQLTDTKRKQILQLSIIVFCAVALKFYYSKANVNDLRWILAPTTAMVEMVTAARFEFEPYSGYMKSDKNFLIAQSCSGVNFLVAAFLLISTCTLWRNRYECPRWRFLVIAGITAYLTTIIANTVRISTALRLQAVPAETGMLDDAQIHRIEGIVVYFGFLLLLYFIVCKMNPERRSGRYPKGPIRDLLIPLMIYYAMVLAVPFANGGYRQGAVFWEHLFFVIVTPALLLLPIAAIKLIGNRRTSVSPDIA